VLLSLSSFEPNNPKERKTSHAILLPNQKLFVNSRHRLCVALLSVGSSTAQQPVAPTATLEVAPATIVDPQPNYVMEQPVPPREIPFRPTMDRTAYDAAKARANSYAPEQ